MPKRPSWRALLSSSGLLSARRYNYSDTWQLVINTATTIITFLMLFIIQNTQNRDARAIQLKLDERFVRSRGLGQDWDEWRPPGKAPTQITRYLIQHSS